jgi:hypothetical protein
MVDRVTFDRIKLKHGGYASWAIWAEPSGKPKSNIGDLSVLDPDKNPTLLPTLRNDVVMVGLSLSREPWPEPFRNFHDARPQGQDYKIRHAFADTQYWGAYMTDVIKDVAILSRASVMRYLNEDPSLLGKSLTKLLEEFNDLGCDRPSIVAFGSDAHRLVADNLPPRRYSRLIKLRHYSDYMSQDAYRQEVLMKIGAS